MKLEMQQWEIIKERTTEKKAGKYILDQRKERGKDNLCDVNYNPGKHIHETEIVIYDCCMGKDMENMSSQKHVKDHTVVICYKE